MFAAVHRRASLSAILPGLREHGVLVALILAYGLFAAAISRAYGLSYPLLPNLLAAYFVTLLVPLALAFCWHALWVMIRIRPDRLTLYLFSELKRFAAPRRLLRLAPILLLIPVFAVSFTFLKTAIPVLNPYAWDGVFTRWDYLLHGGHHPWQLMQPWLGYPLATGGINFLYNLWYLVMYVLLILQVFDTRNPALRMRFLLSFLLTWILLGTLMAVLFASMGPCYDPGVGSNTGPYAPLMNYLRASSETVPVPTLQLQQMLWENFQNNGRAVGSGISAMPSMHVAIAVLMALFGWSHSRAAGIALSAYAMIIFIGSIHLAWHYALDGYAGALGAWLIWWLVGRWQNALPDTRFALRDGAVRP